MPYDNNRQTYRKRPTVNNYFRAANTTWPFILGCRGISLRFISVPIPDIQRSSETPPFSTTFLPFHKISGIFLEWPIFQILYLPVLELCR